MFADIFGADRRTARTGSFTLEQLVQVRILVSQQARRLLVTLTNPGVDESALVVSGLMDGDQVARRLLDRALG